MKKNKILSLLVAVTMLASIALSVSAATFEDVSEETHSWAIEAIEEMAEKGIVNGYDDGTFKPNKAVSPLEALSLTARVLGVSDPENEAILNAGIEQYYDIVSEYDIAFGVNDVCYLLIKDILSVEELNEYLEASNVSRGMKRYEIAVLLTKALDAEDEVKKNVISGLEFNDISDIPAYAKRYVEYVTKNGIMSGTGDNMFSPNAEVTRAQIVVLMKKLLSVTNYTFKSGVIAEMDTASRLVRIKTEDDTLKYTVNADVKLRFEGVDVTINDVATGYDAVVTLKGDSLYAIDLITPLVDKEVKGVISSVSSGSKPSLSLYIIDDAVAEINSNAKETYPLNNNVIITYNDDSSSIPALKSGMMVNVVIKKGEVVSVYAYDKSKIENGRVTSVEITPLCKLNLELTDGTEVSYIVSSDVEVTRNGSKATAADVVAGDSVAVTTTYDRITKIVASSKKQSKAGIIQEVIISANPRITVKTANGDVTYSITHDCELEIPGLSSPTFYDLRVGAGVELTLEGDTVVKLTSNVSEGVTQISGTVTSVNTSYSVIQVSYVDSVTGISVIEPIFVKNNAAIVDILTGKTIKFSAINTGAKVTAFGLKQNGVFEATTINVTNN